jgi:glycosyltransferase involved in cell wall biosynthesis
MQKSDILFVHRYFPGQFRLLSSYLAKRNRVVALRDARSDPGEESSQIRCLTYEAAPASVSTHHYVRGTEAAVRRGQAVARAALTLRRQGFRPRIIFAHPGWGEALYLKDMFPDAKLVGLFEFYYHARGADIGFDPEFPPRLDDRLRLRTRNAVNLLSLEACDWGVAPTNWQCDLHPAAFQPRLSVIHDGIDTDKVRPDPSASFVTPRGETLSAQDEVVTYVARDLEPYRGFHSFMRALPDILSRRPRARVLIVGGDGTSYGPPPSGGECWRERMLAELGSRIDRSRVNFLGRISYEAYLRVLQISSVHVYMTYPFVLSWSCLEAMAAGCAVVGSATQPVEEVIVDGKNGLLVDFFSPRAIADAVDSVLDHPDRMAAMRARARETVVERYDFRRVSLPKYLALMDHLLGAPPKASVQRRSAHPARGQAALASVPRSRSGPWPFRT